MLYNVEKGRKKMLVGICGKAGAGKDTVGDYLIKNHNFYKIALADPIKRLVKDVFVLDDHTVYDRKARELPLANFPKWTVRTLLQYIGTELFRNNIDDAIWVKSLWYRIQEDKNRNYVVTDVRFPNELDFFKKNAKEGEFVSIKVVRDGCEGNVGLKGHASEAYDLETQYVIKNNGSFEELYGEVDKVLGINGVGSSPFVIVESPYAGNVKRNEEYAKRCMMDCLKRGEVPFVSHLLYTQVLDDTKPQERALGMGAGFEVIKHSNYSVVYEDYGISKGMEEGINVATNLGHKIEFRRIGKNE